MPAISPIRGLPGLAIVSASLLAPPAGGPSAERAATTIARLTLPTVSGRAGIGAWSSPTRGLLRSPARDSGEHRSDASSIPGRPANPLENEQQRRIG
ncbi:MAG: hypothetical protein CME06_15900 [Gemmatimonadetes bacterium]|nr:hypothetical protein [Gemmatimonadota bacterium]